MRRIAPQLSRDRHQRRAGPAPVQDPHDRGRPRVQSHLRAGVRPAVGQGDERRLLRPREPDRPVPRRRRRPDVHRRPAHLRVRAARLHERRAAVRADECRRLRRHAAPHGRRGRAGPAHAGVDRRRVQGRHGPGALPPRPRPGADWTPCRPGCCSWWAPTRPARSCRTTTTRSLPSTSAPTRRKCPRRSCIAPRPPILRLVLDSPVWADLVAARSNDSGRPDTLELLRELRGTASYVSNPQPAKPWPPAKAQHAASTANPATGASQARTFARRVRKAVKARL